MSGFSTSQSRNSAWERWSPISARALNSSISRTLCRWPDNSAPPTSVPRMRYLRRRGIPENRVVRQVRPGSNGAAANIFLSARLHSAHEGVRRNSGFTVGVGLFFWGQEFSYALVPMGHLWQTNYFSLVFRWDTQARPERPRLKKAEADEDFGQQWEEIYLFRNDGHGNFTSKVISGLHERGLRQQRHQPVRPQPRRPAGYSTPTGTASVPPSCRARGPGTACNGSRSRRRQFQIPSHRGSPGRLQPHRRRPRWRRRDGCGGVQRLRRGFEQGEQAARDADVVPQRRAHALHAAHPGLFSQGHHHGRRGQPGMARAGRRRSSPEGQRLCALRTDGPGHHRRRAVSP